jgi:hypothetical protein
MAQWNKNVQDYLNQERSLHEVYIRADEYGNILNESASSKSAFGEILAIPLTPKVQGDMATPDLELVLEQMLILMVFLEAQIF